MKYRKTYYKSILIVLCIILILSVYNELISDCKGISIDKTVWDKETYVRNLINDVRTKNMWDEGYSGRNITIAVIDTGIILHPDLTGAIKYFVDFVNHKRDPYDDNGHGTKVCGLITGHGNQSTSIFEGVAPGADLVVIKALDEYGSADIITIKESLNWVLNNREKFNIKVLCMAFGYESMGTYEEDPIYSIISKIIDNNILVVASSGNNNSITSPGKLEGVLTVGSIVYDNSINENRVADFTASQSCINDNKKPDVYEYGVDILTTTIDDPKTKYIEYYALVSGTSFSCAIVCGKAALYFEKYNSSKQIRNIITGKLTD